MEESRTHRRIENRIEDIKQAYIEDEIDDYQFEILMEAALDDEAPFRADWFMSQLETRRKRYTEETVYMYCGEEYVVDGEMVMPADSDSIDRTIDVTA